MKRSLALAALTLVVASSCGAKLANTSHEQSISTDLPDTGNLGPVKMYWVQEGLMFRGTCTDKAFVIKTNCMKNLQVMNYGVFKTKLDNGLTATVKSLREEVAAINSAISVVDSDIAATYAALDREEQELGAARADLRETRAEIAKVSTFIGEYRTQLTAIGLRLAVMTDMDLAAQAVDMGVELGQLVAKVNALSSTLPGIIAEIHSIKATITVLNSQLDSLSIRLVNLLSDHDRTATELRYASEDLESYRLTLDMVTDPDGINYRVHAEDQKFQKVRRFVKRFDTIFNAN